MNTHVAPGESLRNYTRAYVEALPKDEFQIFQALCYELEDMGLQVVGKPFSQPTETDLLVRYKYSGGWDMTRYLQSFQISFTNARSGRVVTSTSYRSRGLWMGVRDGRLAAAFNDLRKKNGYAETRQFR